MEKERYNVGVRNGVRNMLHAARKTAFFGEWILLETQVAKRYDLLDSDTITATTSARHFKLNPPLHHVFDPYRKSGIMRIWLEGKPVDTGKKTGSLYVHFLASN